MDEKKRTELLTLMSDGGIPFGWDELGILKQTFDDKATQAKTVTKEHFFAMFKELGVDNEAILAGTFEAWDKDKNGLIDFGEFITALATLLHGSPENKMDLAFDAYDLDNSGFIEFNELVQILDVTTKFSNNAKNKEELEAMATETMKIVDKNKDGKISRDEFKAAVNAHELAISVFEASLRKRIGQVAEKPTLTISTPSVFMKQVEEMMNKYEGTLALLFVGSDESQVWCPECRVAMPWVQSACSKEKSLYLVTVPVGTKEAWKDKAHPYRTNEHLKLEVVPSLVLWSEDGPGRKTVIESFKTKKTFLRWLYEGFGEDEEDEAGGSEK